VAIDSTITSDAPAAHFARHDVPRSNGVLTRAFMILSLVNGHTTGWDDDSSMGLPNCCPNTTQIADGETSTSRNLVRIVVKRRKWRLSSSVR
jgi:hypothetical protein